MTIAQTDVIEQVSVTFPRSFPDARFADRVEFLEAADIVAAFPNGIPTRDDALLSELERHFDLEVGAMGRMAVKRPQNAILVFPDPVFGKMSPEQKFYRDRLSPILDGEITGFIFSESDDPSERWFGLAIKVGEKGYNLWILSDDEGNGPGSFSLVEV